MRIITLIAYLVTLTSCESNSTTSFKKETLPDRNGKAIYQAHIPEGWEREADPPSLDTMLPNCAFSLPDGIRITLYNFPQEPRIPPEAQVARWEKQLKEGEEAAITPASWSGYAGLKFEAPTTLAWALALAPRHRHALDDPHLRADVTLKATGTAEALLKHKEEITDFAHSFELIEEIPQ